MRLSERWSRTDAGLVRPSFPASVHLRGWLWSAAIHGALVGAMVWGGLTLPRRDMQEVFQWEVQLTSATSEMAPSVGIERALWREDRVARESPVAATVPPVRSQRERARETVRQREPAIVSELSVEQRTRHSEPAVSEAEKIVPAQSSAMATEIDASPEAVEALPAPTASVAEASPHEADEAVTRHTVNGRREATGFPDTGAASTAMQDQDERMSGAGFSAKTVASDRASVRMDFGWVGLALRARVEETKRYSIDARLNQWEGRTVIAAVILADGRIIDSRILESSGNSRLDEDARVLVASVSPLKLVRAIEADRLTVKIPIVFGLR